MKKKVKNLTPNHNIKNCFLFLILSILMGCSKKNDEKILKGEINEIEINFVKKKRDWCRLSKIIFKSEIKNESKDTIFFKDFDELDLCDLMKSKCGYLNGFKNGNRPEIWNVLEKKDTIYVSILNKPKFIEPFHKAEIEFTLSEQLIGNSLDELKKNYDWLINSKLNIICEDVFLNNNILVIKMHKTVKKTYYIDDELRGNVW